MRLGTWNICMFVTFEQLKKLSVENNLSLTDLWHKRPSTPVILIEDKKALKYSWSRSLRLDSIITLAAFIFKKPLFLYFIYCSLVAFRTSSCDIFAKVRCCISIAVLIRSVTLLWIGHFPTHRLSLWAKVDHLLPLISTSFYWLNSK